MNVGFVGAGRRATGAHYPSVVRLEGVDVAAVAELDEPQRMAVVDRFGIPNSFDDYRPMLESVELDAVYVVMGETLVTPIAIDCMNAGKHVFIEKPPGANTGETQQLLDAAVANDVRCMVGYQRRHASVVREALRLVGDRGPATLVMGEFHKYLPDGPGATSTLWNDICHVVDLVRFMAGSQVVEVTAHQGSHQWKWKNNYNGIIRFANDAVGIVTGNRSSGGRYIRAELHGDGIGCYLRLPEQLEVYEDGGDPRLLSGAEINGTDPDDTPSYEGVLAMHQEFADCVRSGETPSSDIRDVIHTSRLIDRLEGSVP